MSDLYLLLAGLLLNHIQLNKRTLTQIKLFQKITLLCVIYNAPSGRVFQEQSSNGLNKAKEGCSDVQ